MSQYRRMTYTDRLVIEKLYNAKASYRQIAKATGFAVSSVYREVQRGLYLHRDGDTWKDIPKYSATIAQDDADWQSTARCGTVKLGHNYAYANEVSDRIRNGESPDQIVGQLRKSNQWTVSTTTLYRYIDQGFIPNVTNKNLLIKSTRKRQYNVVRAARAPRGQSIERRPDHINTRSNPGHWEMDTVIGKAEGTNQSILVLTERNTRYELVFKLTNKTTKSIVSALSKAVNTFPQGTFQTITVDNGSEFSDYKSMKQLVPEIYYCHPYSSYERGSNENANKIIRRFFPKGQSLAKRTQKDCDAVAYYMNHMHRKILGYATAAELFEKWQATLR